MKPQQAVTEQNIAFDAESMSTRTLLSKISARGQVAVAFHLPTIRLVASDEQIRGMYFLDSDVDLDEIEAIAMAMGGAAMLLRDGSFRMPPVCPVSHGDESDLLSHHAADLEVLGSRGSLCVGLGQITGYPPVALALDYDDGIARGVSVFSGEPEGPGLDLLAGIGVRIVGSEKLDDGRVVVQLESNLKAHFDSASLSNYQRIQHCNQFFLSHGSTSGNIEQGLVEAARHRIAAGRERLADEVLRITDEALEHGWSLEMRTPETDTTKPYGDLVPLGFLGAALRVITEAGGQRAGDAKTRLDRVHKLFELNRREGFWGYSIGCIPTSTDTALVSLSGVLPDIEAVEQLRGMGKGFIPQLIADDRPGIAMSSSSSADHWVEEDVPTTALLDALRIDAGLETKTDAQWYLSCYPRWGGLYFNNPALSIWAIARIAGRLKPFEKMAEELIKKDEKSTKDHPLNEEIGQRKRRRELRKVITDRLMSLHNESGSFGRYDPILTNSFSVLALDELSLRGRLLFSAQAHVLDAWEQSTTVETPFHSTLILPQAGNAEEIARKLHAPGRRMVGDHVHAISTYEDPHRLIVSAAACLALHVNADPENHDVPTSACTHRLASSPTEQACMNVTPYCEPRQELGSGLNGPFSYPARRAPILDCTTSILRKLGSQLVSTQSQAWLENIASSTIDDHIGASTFGLEIRLHEGDATIDYLWHASRSSQNISALLNNPDDSSSMRHLSKLWDQNNEDGKPAIAFIDNIWFEFDHDVASELPPGFFFGPSKLTKDVEKTYGVSAVARNVRRVVQSLCLEASHEAQMLSVADRIAELPTDWTVFQVGLMFSRSDSPIRLCFAPKTVCEISTSALVDWTEIEHLVRPAEEHGHKAAVCIDVSDHGVSKRVGLELHYSNDGLVNTYLEDLRNLFNAYLELGIVSASRYESFLNAEGWEEINSHGGVNTRINHIKCVVQPDHPVGVKGYLALKRSRRPHPRI